ncbi:MAG: hypothetical protein GKC53_00365 [Neisseriaceae bacterium]|nr:MAG: hypothetical protein GKC53_00365 [Neisseriaceae bacterium]
MVFFEKNKSNTRSVTHKKIETEEPPSWLRHLEEMREKRKEKEKKIFFNSQKNNELANISVRSENTTNKINFVTKKTSADYVNHNNSSPEIKNKIYQYYLKKWQQEHNQSLNDQVGETQILLANRWTLKSDNILLQSDSISEEDSSVLFFNDSQELEKANPNESDQNEEMSNEDLPNTMISVTVVKPNLNPNKNLCIVDEKEFVESIKAQLKPHLQDILEGMIKNMLLNNYEIMLSCVQKEIQSEIPNVIDDILEHNVKSIIKR